MTRLGVLPKILLTAGIALAPMSAFAAFTMPSELVKAAKSSEMPMNVAVEVQAQKAPIYVTMWFNGTVKGATPETASLSAKATVDAVWENGNARAKLQMRQTDGTMYLLVDDIQGKMEDGTARMLASFKMKKWFEIPKNDMYMGLPVDELNMMGMSDDEVTMLDQLFTVTSKAGSNGTTIYTLVPTPMMMEGLKSALQDMASDFDSMSMEPMAEPTFDATIVMDSANHVVSANLSLMGKNTDGMVKATVKVTRAAANFSVSAPAPIYSWDEGLFGFGKTGVDGWPAWIGYPTQDFTSDPWDDYNWNEDTYVPSEDCTDAAGCLPDDWMEDNMTEDDTWYTPTCNASQLRRGECPEMLPTSPRRNQ